MRTFTFRSTFLYGVGGGRGCYLEHGEEGDNKTVKIGLRGPVREVKCSAKQLKQTDVCCIVVGEKGALEDSGEQSKKEGVRSHSVTL
jgi:hypothetical protein